MADVLPTFLDMAHLPAARQTFGGRAVLPLRGKSWVPWLQDKAPRVYGAGDVIDELLFGGRSLRRGDWKITDVGDGTWRLFNVSKDPGETVDLSPAAPRKRRNSSPLGRVTRDKLASSCPSPDSRLSIDRSGADM